MPMPKNSELKEHKGVRIGIRLWSGAESVGLLVISALVPCYWSTRCVIADTGFASCND